MGRTARIRRKLKKETDSCTDKDFLSLLHWLLSKGWQQTTKMKLKHFPDTGRGFMANETINYGDVIVRIPKSLVITAKTVEDSGIGELFIDNNFRVPIHLVLTTFVLFEKHLGEKSIWYRYISMLPESYSSPLFLSSTELENFPSFLTEKVDGMRNCIHLMFQTLLKLSDLKNCKHCKKLFYEIFSFESFLWAWFTVNSRVVYISPQENFHHNILLSDSNSIAMVPFLDMLNHSNNARIAATFSLENGYELKSLVSYKKYEQVYIHYGSHDNLKLFLEYGFIIPNNINDTIPIRISDIFNVIGNIDSSKKKLLHEHFQTFLENLYCSNEGLSWNSKVLIYLMISENSNHKVVLQNVYAGSFGSDNLTVNRIEKNIIFNKIEEMNKITAKLLINENIILLIGRSLFEFYLKVLNEAIAS